MHPDGEPPIDARSASDEPLVTARPPEVSRVVAMWSVSTRAGVGVMRRELSAWTESGAGSAAAVVSRDVAARVVLVASELAFNALQHGTLPVVVQVLMHGDRLILDVADHDPSTAPVVAGQRPAGEGGFGLVIAGRLADQIAWYVSPPAKHIWAIFSPS